MRVEISTRGVGLAASVSQLGEKAKLVLRFLWPTIYIPLWFRLKTDYWEPWPSYGFNWHFSEYRGALFLYWRTCKIVWMPWDWKYVRHDVLMKDNTWKRVKDRTDWLGLLNDLDCCPWNWPDKYQERIPYTYTRKNGKIQIATATIGVEEREWRWRWFTWLPWPRMIRRSIEVEFDNEIGEQAGSWKGGVLGCSYDLLPDETPYDCLRRMERERKFN